MKYLTAIDLNNNEIQNAKVQNLGTDPSGLVSGNAGRVWYNSTDNHAKVWNGTAVDYLSNLLETISVDATLTATPSGKNVALAVQVASANTASKIVTRDSSGNFSAGTITASLTGTASNATQLAGQSLAQVRDFSQTTGTRDHTSISDFDTQVRSSRLDQMAAPTSSLSFNSQKGVNVLDPTGPQDVASKNYVDSVASGLDAKASVRVATTAALAANTYANGANGVGATLTANANGAIAAIDGQNVGTAVNQTITNVTNSTTTVTATVTSTAGLAIGQTITVAGITGFTTNNPNGTFVVNTIPSGTTFTYIVGSAPTGSYTSGGTVVANADRVLVKNEATAANNGIYVVTQIGTGGTPYILTRATDANTNTTITPGLFTFVEQGATNGAQGWVLSTSGAITVGTTALSFSQFSSSTAYSAGNGLQLSTGAFSVVGTTNRISVSGAGVDISSSYVGQTSITTLGTVTSGTWTGTAIAVANGGTGATSAASARTNLGAVGKASINIPAGSSYAFAHNLGTTDVDVVVKDTASLAIVQADYVVTDSNTVTLTFASSVSANAFRVTVIG
jgi:hypothetical protein